MAVSRLPSSGEMYHTVVPAAAVAPEEPQYPFSASTTFVAPLRTALQRSPRTCGTAAYHQDISF